jgi:LPS O-antigen subunit length determinant protein (WzzB/FepE family)
MSNASTDEGQTLRVDLVEPLIAYRRLIATVAAAFAILTVLIKLVWPVTYVATAAIAPADTSSLPSGRLAQLSGLASLAGVNLGTADHGASNFDRFRYLLTSAELAQWEIEHRHILSIVYSDWDDKTRSWQPPSNLFGTFKTLFGPRKAPDPFAVARLLDSHVTINSIVSPERTDTLGNIYMITYWDTDPTRAAAMLQNVIAGADEIVRSGAQERARLQANFLEE